MVKPIDSVFIITTLAISFALVNSVPTSVLLNSKATVPVDNNKVKRTLNSANPSTEKSNEEKAQLTHSSTDDKKPVLQKRGVNSPYYEREMPNDNYGNNYATGGLWGEDVIEPGILYPQLQQDIDEYRSSAYHPKAYESLQNMLNSNIYEEPIALPLQYQYPRYFSDRSKRSNNAKNMVMRLKRESKLSPADMLALVALVEAGQRSRYGDPAENSLGYGKSYPYELPQQQEENFDWYSPWADSAEYYGMPYENLEGIPRYEAAIKENHQNYPSKRFMVAKKKRSSNLRESWHHGQDRFLNTANIAPGFDSRISLPDSLENSNSRKFQGKYF